jgi:hypothetical protein
VDLTISESVSFYPRVTFGAESVHQDQQLLSGQSISTASSAFGSSSQTNTGAWLNVFAPLLLHPRQHFFIGLGPRVFHGFAKTVGVADVGGERTRVGAGLIVGGHWGGEPEETHAGAPSTEAPPPRERRFGEAGEVVLSGELSASLDSLTYRGSDAQYVSAGFAPGFDVFVANHLSLGVDFAVSYGSTTGYGSDGSRIDYTTTSYGIAPRVGVDVPIASSLSLYPRAELGFGTLTQDETSTNSYENKHTISRVWVSLYAPLLVHPAPHFFVGFGPLVLHELSSSDQYQKDNRRTTIGASLLLGGWL